MPGKIIEVPLNDIDRDFLCQSIFREWSKAIDEKKLANAMTFDRKIHGDMQSFLASKKSCIESASEKFNKFDEMLNRLKGYSPMVNGEWYKA